MDSQKQKMQKYWKRNIRTLLILLTVWFIVSFGFGILLVEPLNAIKIGGYKLGFWFAQQGSIFSFVIIIFVYVYRMNKLDEEFDVNEK
jgi:putative solute:sodium symporter small subunit